MTGEGLSRKERIIKEITDKMNIAKETVHRKFQKYREYELKLDGLAPAQTILDRRLEPLSYNEKALMTLLIDMQYQVSELRAKLNEQE